MNLFLIFKEIVKTICTFAKTRSGVILIRVSDKDEIKGVKIGKKMIEDLVLKIIVRSKFERLEI